MSQPVRSRVQLEVHVVEHHPWVFEHGLAELVTQESPDEAWVGTGIEFVVLSPPPGWDQTDEILDEVVREAVIASGNSAGISGAGPVDALLVAQAAGVLDSVTRVVLIAAIEPPMVLDRGELGRVLAGIASHYRPGPLVALLLPGRDQVDLRNTDFPLVGGWSAEGFRQVSEGVDVWVMGGSHG